MSILQLRSKILATLINSNREHTMYTNRISQTNLILLAFPNPEHLILSSQLLTRILSNILAFLFQLWSLKVDLVHVQRLTKDEYSGRISSESLPEHVGPNLYTYPGSSLAFFHFIATYLIYSQLGITGIPKFFSPELNRPFPTSI